MLWYEVKAYKIFLTTINCKASHHHSAVTLFPVKHLNKTKTTHQKLKYQWQLIINDSKWMDVMFQYLTKYSMYNLQT